MMQKLEILTGVQESNDYPYGRLRCHITFEVEFKKGHGYRFKTQTTNPKNQRVNKPKHSTYVDFMVMYKDENGHIKPYGMHIRGYEDIAKFIEFITVHEIEFTAEQSNELWMQMTACIRSNAMYTRLKEDVEVATFLNTCKADKMIHHYGEKSDINQIKEIGYDLQAILDLKA